VAVRRLPSARPQQEVSEMTGRAIGSIDPGEVDAEVVERAARRISDYLMSHPDDDLIEALGELGDADALVTPRPTAILFAQKGRQAPASYL
jgi:hypothetical protein